MTILDALVAEPVPLRADGGGVLRVGRTRVRLDSVLYAFNAGCGAEEILLKFPSLELTDIYSVIAYYLWRRPEVDAYLAERRHACGEACQEAEERFPSAGLRERLLARRAAKSE